MNYLQNNIHIGQTNCINNHAVKNKGGKRKGAGRKPAPYQTKTIAFRVRLEWVEVIKSMVKSKVAELSQNSS